MIIITVTMPTILVRGKQRIVNEMLKEAWTDMGAYWHKHYRPRHFQKRWAKQYGYASRVGETQTRQRSKGWRSTYTGRKYVKFGHTNPLVWSGTSRDRSAIRRISAKKDGVDIRLNAPGLNRKNPNSRVDMLKEIRTVIDSERRVLVKRLDDSIHKGFIRLFRRHRVTVRYAA